MPMNNNRPGPFDRVPGVSPNLSQATNTGILSMSPTDGNIGAYEDAYGTPGTPPSPYSTGSQGLSPEQTGEMQAGMQSFDMTMDMFRKTLGDEAATMVMQEVLQTMAAQDQGRHAVGRPQNARPPGSLSPKNLPRKR